ncbi:MAG: DUF58 domain-containing protein [Oscillospiraceae bacterium]|nr:DUF58 domain-containing protein [Oscillospiraceae bacterium]
MVLNRIVYLLSLIGCTVFYCCYREWLGWIVFLAAWASLPLSLVLTIPNMTGLKLRLDCPFMVPLGKPGKVRLKVANALPAPPIGGGFRVTRVTTGETWKLKDGADLPTDHCGQLKVEPVKLRLYDYLGVLRLPAKVPRTAMVLVRPTPVPVDNPPGLHRYLATAWKPKPGGGFAENHELRLYRPGDSLSQIHWKLSAKTGKLVLREPMEPIRGKALLTMDIAGGPDALDIKFGQLLWMSRRLLIRGIPHEIRCLTGNGIQHFGVSDEDQLLHAIDALLGMPCADGGTIAGKDTAAVWQYHVGGDSYES